MPKKIEVTWRKITDWIAIVIVSSIGLQLIKGILATPKAIEVILVFGFLGIFCWAIFRVCVILQRKDDKNKGKVR